MQPVDACRNRRVETGRRKGSVANVDADRHAHDVFDMASSRNGGLTG
jgi:hypothetical protein